MKVGALGLVVAMTLATACSREHANANANANADADADAGACAGACEMTTLTGSFGGKTGALDRAQHGTETGSGGEPLLYVEAHSGGDPACPTDATPAPDRTLIVANVPRGKVGDHFTKADGVTAAFFDFAGDLGLPPTTKATAVDVTIVALDAADPPTFVALDVTATFAEGSVKGHAYASYCASLSK